MTFLSWEARYDIGTDFVDRRRKQLVDIINRLHGSIETHFKDEERMAENRCPQLTSHEAAHREFIARVQQMRRRFLAREVVGDRVPDYLKSRLTPHIPGTDRQCAQYLKGAEHPESVEA